MYSMRKAILAALAAASFVVASASGAVALPKPPPSIAPVPAIAEDFPDPVVREYNGTYYAFATGSMAFHIPMKTSPDGVVWTATAEALPSLAAWADPKPFYTWAPYVWRFGNAYMMY